MVWHAHMEGLVLEEAMSAFDQNPHIGIITDNMAKRTKNPQSTIQKL